MLLGSYDPIGYFGNLSRFIHLPISQHHASHLLYVLFVFLLFCNLDDDLGWPALGFAILQAGLA